MTVGQGNISHQNEFGKFVEENIAIRTVRAILNLSTNILIVLTVFVCLLYSWTSPKLNVFQLHIVLCVLGYQFFMCQGTLVLSKYNSWSMYLRRKHKIRLHWILQLIGFIFVAVGSILMLNHSYVNFSTSHGITGFCALLTSLIGMLNGMLALNSFKLSSYVNALWIKFFHHFAGVGTLVLSATCLCLGFDNAFFRKWAGNEHTILLMIITCIFTLLVAIDFWLATGTRIRNMMYLIDH